MTEQEITALGPAFAAYLRRFRGLLRPGPDGRPTSTPTAGGCCPTCPARASSRSPWQPGPPSAPSRSSWSPPGGTTTTPATPSSGTSAAVLADLPADPLGTVGVIDETSCRKWGDQTPGVQRQYLGCVGKIDNGIVTVHVGVAQGTVPGPAGRRPVPAQGRGTRTASGAGRPASPTTSGTGRSGGSRWTSGSG